MDQKIKPIGTKKEIDIKSRLRGLLSLSPGLFMIYLTIKTKIFEPSITNQELLVQWKALRDVFYLGYAGLFLLLGLAVILKKINPKESKNSLPATLVASLLFTTFSYALADLMLKILGFNTIFNVN